MKYELSVCIPTYNRGQYIGETIESVISQVDDNNPVQIVISDNASQDNTKEIIENYQKQYSHIKYFCFDENMGADRNFLKSVSLANGRYCLICGSDDVLKNEALKIFMSSINDHQADIYLYDRDECDINMKHLRERFWFKEKLSVNIPVKNSVIVSIADYFDQSASLGCVFSYLTSNLFKKEVWDSFSCCEKFIGSAYSHTFMLLSILKNGGSLVYENEKVVDCRVGNDSFLDNNESARFLLDFDGYLKLADRFFVGKENENLKRVLKREHGLKGLIKFFFYAKSDNRNKSDKKFIEAGFNRSEIFLSKVLGLKPIFHGIKFIFKACNYLNNHWK